VLAMWLWFWEGLGIEREEGGGWLSSVCESIGGWEGETITGFELVVSGAGEGGIVISGVLSSSAGEGIATVGAV
jgi:L-rhamnose isomerase